MSTKAFIEDMCGNKKDQPLGFSNESMISIKAIELDRLIMRDVRLSQLEAAGVDSWEGYSEAIKIVIDDDELES